MRYFYMLILSTTLTDLLPLCTIRLISILFKGSNPNPIAHLPTICPKPKEEEEGRAPKNKGRIKGVCYWVGDKG